MNHLCFLAFLAGPTNAILAGPEIKPNLAEQAGVGEKAFSTLQEGLEVLRRDYRPLLCVYLAEEENGKKVEPGVQGKGFAAELKRRFQNRELQKVLRAFVRVNLARKVLELPYPAAKDAAPEKKKEATKKRIRETLGIVPGVPAMVVLDFRERVVRRYQEKLPPQGVLRRELKRIALNLSKLAATARRIEKLMESAEYSYALGETRVAVQRILPLDDQKVQRTLDPVLAERLASVLSRYKDDAAKAMAVGEALESERRYLEAVQAYQKAAFRFPFPEILKKSAIRQGVAMRKAQGGL